MSTWRVVASVCVILAVGGCGGGGGRGKSAKPAVPATAVSVAIASQALSTDVTFGENFRATVAGTWSATSLGSNQVYLEISDSAGTFSTPAAQPAGSSSDFNYYLSLSPAVGVGPRSGTLTVRACRDAQCAQPYANAAARLDYQLQIGVPTVSVAITSPAITGSVDSEDNYRAVVQGTWTGRFLGTGKVYLQIGDSARTFAAPVLQAAPGHGAFRFAVSPLGTLPVGPRSGVLTVRACRDTLCSLPYDNAVASITYDLELLRIGEWKTHQRNAAHDGYVPIMLDPTRFTKAWEWQRPSSGSSISGINEVVTSNGTVYLTTNVYFQDGKLYALNENDGQVRWTVSFGNVPALNPPAFSNGRVYATTTGHEATFIWSFDAADGAFKFKAPFASQWQSVLGPTVFDDQVYSDGGYYGGIVHAWDALGGSELWKSDGGVGADMATPAVDQNNVYFHNGAKMVIWNRMTGEPVASIADPFGSGNSVSLSSYFGSPILGERNNAIGFAGSAFSGSGSSSSEQYDQRVLSSFNIGSRTWEWSTGNTYLTQPAVANGVIYAGRNNPMSLDAIDEATGKVLWSWVPQPGPGDTEFHRNIVVTQNVLFVSTDKSVYAVDLATRQAAWRYPAPGNLAISSNSTLYIATGARSSDGKLVAIKLK